MVRNRRIDPILWISRYAVLGIERANERDIDGAREMEDRMSERANERDIERARGGYRVNERERQRDIERARERGE